MRGKNLKKKLISIYNYNIFCMNEKSFKIEEKWENDQLPTYIVVNCDLKIEKLLKLTIFF